jgi:hypothetical protein
MLAPPTFPKWLPAEVAIEADRILNAGTADDDLVIRLATDERMRFVWRALSKPCARARPQLSETWAIMTKVDVEPPQDSDPLSLFFWCAYTLASLKLVASRVPRADLPIAEYKMLAAELRFCATMLRRLNFQHSDDWDFGDRHIKEIEGSADFCDRITDAFGKVKAVQAPLVVRRSHGNLRARGYVRMLAIEARKLFGKPALYRTLATVASVALMKRITDVQVRKWCDSLDKIT